jgi:hypothetical protein
MGKCKYTIDLIKFWRQELFYFIKYNLPATSGHYANTYLIPLLEIVPGVTTVVSNYIPALEIGDELLTLA